MEAEPDSQTKVYTCASYLSTLKDGMSSIKQEFCDANLVAGGKTFRAHKIILAASARYFYSIFVQNFKESKSAEIKMPPQIDSDAMQTILDYFYTGEFVLSKNNIKSVFKATDYMRLDTLLELCIEYMHETLDPSNCIGRYLLLESIQYYSARFDSLNEAASALIVQDGGKYSAIMDVSSLSFELISKIINSNNKPGNAESLYNFIVKWVGCDEDNRRQYLPSLLETLPVDGFSSDFFDTIMKNEGLLRRDPKSVLWLLDNSIIRNSTPGVTLSQLTSFFFADRETIHKCYLVRAADLKTLPLHDRPVISKSSAVCYKRRIYLFCTGQTEKAYRLDDPQQPWLNCEMDLSFSGIDGGFAILGDELFIVGGYKALIVRKKCIRSRVLVRKRIQKISVDYCVKFNFELGLSEHCPLLKEERIQPGVAVYANSLYAACGADSSPSIERFDPREGEWRKVGRYKTDIGACSSATVADCLYSCGLKNGIVERFDFRSNQSQEIRGLPSAEIENKWITSIGNDIFCANGGSILKYEATADEWTNVCPKMDVQSPIIVPWI